MFWSFSHLVCRCLLQLVLLRGRSEAFKELEIVVLRHDLRHSHASMLIALDYSVVDVQHRLGHRKPDTTLRVYTHQWKYRDAQKSHIGAHIGQLFTDSEQKQIRAGGRRLPLALPPAPTP